MPARRGPDGSRLALLLLIGGAALAVGISALPLVSRASVEDGAGRPPTVFLDMAGAMRLGEPGPSAPPEVVGTWILEGPLPPRHDGDGAANPIRLTIGAHGLVQARVVNSMTSRVDPRSLADGRFVPTEFTNVSLMMPSPRWETAERQLFSVPSGGAVVLATGEELVLSTPAGATLRFRRDQGDEPVNPRRGPATRADPRGAGS